MSVNRSSAACFASAASVTRKCVPNGNSAGGLKKFTSADRSDGSATTASTNIVAVALTRGPAKSHAPSKSSSIATGTRLRRRLSKIFHHDKAEIGFFTLLPSAPGTLGNSHRAICQSPRIHRCRRLTSAG